MTLDNMTWGELQDSTTLLDCIDPTMAHDYLAKHVFMDFDAQNELAYDKKLDAFRDNTLLPAIRVIASYHIPELRSDEEKSKEVGMQIWQTVMFTLVTSNDLPALDDPDRDEKVLMQMDDLVKQMVTADAEPEAPTPGM